ncbi:hypothetical protein AB0J86_12170 [Micromonospora sp. NPDC049559]|uniref:hypothetical protein n=1 Tax=Micromonospora sp. NPDC049559 TaxID=3155923 RepID=UPI0034338636
MWDFDDGTQSPGPADRHAGHPPPGNETRRRPDPARHGSARTGATGRRPTVPLAILVLVAVVVAAVVGYLTPGVTGLLAAVGLGLVIAAVAFVVSQRGLPRTAGQPGRTPDGRRLQIWLGVLGAVATLLAAGLTPLVERIGAAGDDDRGGGTSTGTGATPELPAGSASSAGATADASAPPPFPSPNANCGPRRINVDTYRASRMPLPVSHQMELAGRDHWPGDPRKLWIFVTGGGTEQYYPYEKPIPRTDGAWVAYGVVFGRKGEAADLEMGLRYAVVALVPPAAADRLARRIGEPDFWTGGNPDGAGQIPTLPAGSEVYAKVPVQLACV